MVATLLGLLVISRGAGAEAPASALSGPAGAGQRAPGVQQAEAGRKWRSGPSPAATLLRSIAFPGWGQLENDRPFKAATVFAVETGLILSGVVEYRRAQRSRDDEQAAALLGDTETAAVHFNHYVDRRDRAVNRLWWSTFTLMMSMIDAYTDGHLRDFVPAPVPELKPEDVSPERFAPPFPSSPPPAPQLELGIDLAPGRVGLAVRF